MLHVTILACVFCICATFLLWLHITHSCKHKFIFESKTKVERRKEGSLGAYENRFYPVECHLSRCEKCGKVNRTYVD